MSQTSCYNSGVSNTQPATLWDASRKLRYADSRCYVLSFSARDPTLHTMGIAASLRTDYVSRTAPCTRAYSGDDTLLLSRCGDD